MVEMTYRDVDGRKVSKSELRVGDRVALRVKWFAEPLERPTMFTVVESPTHVDDVKLEGDDGHTYRLLEGRMHVLCTDDGKEGSHRGNLAGRIKKVRETVEA